MDLPLIEYKTPEKSPHSDTFFGENYELKLKLLIQSLLEKHNEENTVFDDLESSFYQLMQVRIDPPFETLWFYSGLRFRVMNSMKQDDLDRVSMVKDLFQLISACSSSCSGFKSIALLAPVVFEANKLVVNLLDKDKDLSDKRHRKVMRDIRALIDSVIGFIGVCCCSRDLNEKDDDPIDSCSFLMDLVSVWSGEELGFFPLVSNSILRELTSVENCDVRDLAGVVIAEAFLMRLCLKFKDGVSRVELQKELRKISVGYITGFQSFHLFEILVTMLLEPTLPVSTLLCSEDEAFLRKILYDAVILVDYAFLKHDRVTQLHAERMKNLAVTRLIVTHEAIEFFRKDGDQTRAISYINAFSCSRFPSELIKWATCQTDTDEDSSRQTGSSPKAILKWLLNLEDKGIKIFDDSVANNRAKLVIEISNEDPEERLGKQNKRKKRKKLEDDLLFYIDKKGEDEDEDEDEDVKVADESVGAAFVAAAQTMMVTQSNKGVKRRKKTSIEKKKIKFIKYDLNDDSDSAKKVLAFGNYDLESRSDVSVSDEDE